MTPEFESSGLYNLLTLGVVDPEGNWSPRAFSNLDEAHRAAAEHGGWVHEVLPIPHYIVIRDAPPILDAEPPNA